MTALQSSLTITLTLNHDLDFQSPAKYGHDPYERKLVVDREHASMHTITHTHTHTHTHPFNGPFSGTTQVSQYQKGKTNLDFTEARDS